MTEGAVTNPDTAFALLWSRLIDGRPHPAAAATPAVAVAARPAPLFTKTDIDRMPFSVLLDRWPEIESAWMAGKIDFDR